MSHLKRLQSPEALHQKLWHWWDLTPEGGKNIFIRHGGKLPRDPTDEWMASIPCHESHQVGEWRADPTPLRPLQAACRVEIF